MSLSLDELMDDLVARLETMDEDYDAPKPAATKPQLRLVVNNGPVRERSAEPCEKPTLSWEHMALAEGCVRAKAFELARLHRSGDIGAFLDEARDELIAEGAIPAIPEYRRGEGFDAQTARYIRYKRLAWG